MTKSIDKRLIFVLSISFILVAIGAFLLLTTTSIAQSSTIANQLIVEDINFMPVIANWTFDIVNQTL